VETMRPLPVEPVPDLPPFVLGVALIRGVAVPVIDAARLLGAAGSALPTRYVTLRVGERQVALAVCAVIGVRLVSGAALADIPPLLNDAHAGTVAAIGTLDAELLLVLQASRLVPDSIWATLALGEPAL